MYLNSRIRLYFVLTSIQLTLLSCHLSSQNSDSVARKPNFQGELRIKLGVAIKIQPICSTDTSFVHYRDFVKLHDIVTISDALRPQNFIRGAQGKGKHSPELLRQCLDSLKLWGVSIKGHFLIHGEMEGTPSIKNYLETGNANHLPKAFEEIDKRLEATYPTISSWDFLNHPRYFIWDINSAKRLKILFDMTKAKYPNLALGINEGKILSSSDSSHFQRYTTTLNLFKSVGLNFDQIGEMAHFTTSDIVAPEVMQHRLSKLALFGQVTITEFDLRYGERNTLSRDANNDLTQLKQTENYLQFFLNNQYVDSFISWGFWAPEHWYPNAAYFNADWTQTPNGTVYSNAINRRVKSQPEDRK